MRYRFAPYVLDADNFRLLNDEVEVALEPLVFDLLLFLVERAGTVVTRDAILARVWKGRVVSDSAISSAVKAARKALGDDGRRQNFIQTVHGRGFKFVALAQLESDPSSPMQHVANAIEFKPAATAAPVPLVEVAAPSIAVLPFVPLASDLELDVIGDALAQEVILELSRLHWLFVISRGSTFQFRGSQINLEKTAQILGARYLLTGTVQRLGKQLAVAVELSHAVDKQIVWAERFVTNTTDVMHLRSTLASEIVGVLETRIQFSEAMHAGKVPTSDLSAWAAYHRGLWHMFRFDRRDNDTAMQLFGVALKADPQFARAHAALSFTHFQNAFLGFSSDVDAERRNARRHAERGLELDPLDPFVNLTMGRAEWLDENLEASVSWMDRSIALNPNYAFALYNSGLVGTFLGDSYESDRRVAKAISLSPIDPLNYAMLATRALAHLISGNDAAAAQWAERAVRSPNAHVQIYVVAAACHFLAGEPDKARGFVPQIKRRQPNFTSADFFRFFIFRDSKVVARLKGALDKLGI